MLNGDDRYKVIELLMAHELKIAELYDIYSGNFPELGSFWKKIASEEKGHARMLKGLLFKVKNGEVVFRRDKFPSPAVRASLEHLDQLIGESAGTGGLLVGALESAMDIEQGLIEMEYYKVVEGDTEEVVYILNKLDGDEKRHRMQVQEKLAGLKGNRS